MKFKEYYLLEDKNLPKFIMTVGIPGSGKSTWLKKQSDLNIVSTDDIRKEITGDVSNISKDKDVWKIAKTRVIQLLNKGKDVVLDATNVDSDKREDFLKGLPKSKLLAKIFNVNPEESKKRIRKDIKDKKNRSNVPPEVIDDMYKKFKAGIGKLKQQGFGIIK